MFYKENHISDDDMTWENRHNYDSEEYSSVQNENLRYKHNNKYKKKSNHSIDNISSRSDTERQYFYYKVKSHDTLFSISKRYNTSCAEISSLNCLSNQNILKEGMSLKIPGSTVSSKKNYKKNENLNADIISHASVNKFSWPVKTIINTKRDGMDGVKSIGIIITSKDSSSVLASADGIVSKIGFMRGYGTYIIVKHNRTFLTIYSNLKSIKVKEGENVKKGYCLGSIEGNKLHFQIGRSGKPDDPLKYLRKES